MPHCDFNKVAKKLYWNYTSAWTFFFKFSAYFQNIFYKNNYGGIVASRVKVVAFKRYERPKKSKKMSPK